MEPGSAEAPAPGSAKVKANAKKTVSGSTKHCSGQQLP
jgi:hypothetical protein